MGRPRKQLQEVKHSDLILAYCRVSTGRQALGLEGPTGRLEGGASQDGSRSE